MSPESTHRLTHGIMQDAKDIENLRKALGVDYIDLLGHSYGGHVALLYALNYPDNVGNLVLCGVPLGETDEEIDRRIESHPISKKMEKAKSREKRKKLYYQFYYHKPPSKENLYYNKLIQLAYKTEKNQRLLRAYDDDPFNTDLAKKISDLHKSLLVIVGKYDPITCIEAIENTIAGARCSRLAVCEESGHEPFVDEPDKFSGLVNDFLDGL